MNVSNCEPEGAKRLRCCCGGGDQQASVKRTQIEAPVEAIAERCEVARGVFLEIEGMVATGQAGLEIAEDGVDPLELGVSEFLCARRSVTLPRC